MLEYLKDAIDTFAKDPADSDYQRGYLAALVEALEWLQANPASVLIGL